MPLRSGVSLTQRGFQRTLRESRRREDEGYQKQKADEKTVVGSVSVGPGAEKRVHEDLRVWMATAI